MAVGPWTTCASVTQTPETLFFPASEPLLVAVADGLGGHPAGEVASTIVVQELARLGPKLHDEDSVHAALQHCNEAVYEAAARERGWTGMATTVAGVVLTERSAVVFNVGDSRVYALDGDGLAQVSVDDNPPLRPGETHTPVLTQTVGGHPGDRAMEPHVVRRPPDAGCTYLVCSDGLSDVVGDERIGTLLGDLHGRQAVYELWRAAIEAGGPDNVTVAVVESGDSSTGDA